MAKFRAGDKILHRPSGETWIVARCLDTLVNPCGWPLSAGLIEDCELIEAASEMEHLRTLHGLASIHGDDPRGISARRILAERGDVRTRWAAS